MNISTKKGKYPLSLISMSNTYIKYLGLSDNAIASSMTISEDIGPLGPAELMRENRAFGSDRRN